MLRVVIADDSDLIRALVRDALERAGHSVVAEVAGGRDAVEAGLRHRPDAFVLDVHMREMSGVDAVGPLRAACPEAFVVMFSGDDTRRDDAIGAGADAFVSRSEGVETVLRALGRRPSTSDVMGDDTVVLDATPKGAHVTPEVLFVCVHNAGRSQMAAALLDHHAAGRVRVRSAGSAPASEINPAVVAALAEIGLDVSREFPKPLDDDAARAANVIVTMGCGDACPVYPGKRYLDWELPDPAGKPLEEVRSIRDAIDRLVRALLAEVVREGA